MATRLFACFSQGSSSIERKTTADSATEEHRRAGPVVVELFSSQGCGTSPEDESIATRLADGEIVDVPVLVLAFHVDYWDYRGWKDPFGSSAWTARQKAYVESMRLDTLYTPQIIVQGRDQCLGKKKVARGFMSFSSSKQRKARGPQERVKGPAKQLRAAKFF